MADINTSPSCSDQFPTQPNVEFIFTSDESWSHVEDMALRRRIQNKAAQRRYRRKMREQQAASTVERQSPPSLALKLTPSTSDLPWCLDFAQQPDSNALTSGEQIPALSWDSESCIFSNGTPNDPILYTNPNPQEELLFPPSVNSSRPSSAASASSCFNASICAQDTGLLSQTGQAFNGALSVDDPFYALGAPEELNCQLSPSPIGPRDTNADRLAKRIQKTLDELSLLYDIGIELELVPQDNDMFTQLESLKRGFVRWL